MPSISTTNRSDPSGPFPSSSSSTASSCTWWSSSRSVPPSRAGGSAGTSYTAPATSSHSPAGLLLRAWHQTDLLEVGSEAPVVTVAVDPTVADVVDGEAGDVGRLSCGRDPGKVAGLCTAEVRLDAHRRAIAEHPRRGPLEVG